MMKQKQKWLSGVALVSLFFLFTGCGEQPQEPVEPIQQTQQSDAGGGETGPSQQQPVEETSPRTQSRKEKRLLLLKAACSYLYQ